MPCYRVELRGESREVYYVEADDPDLAAQRWWTHGQLELSEMSSMEVVSVSEDDL